MSLTPVEQLIWTKEMTLEFIDKYEQEQILWNNGGRRNKRADREDAWIRVQRSLSFPCTLPQLKLKLQRLMMIYYKGRGYLQNRSSNGKSEANNYAFKRLFTFLNSRCQLPRKPCRPSLDPSEIKNQSQPTFELKPELKRKRSRSSSNFHEKSVPRTSTQNSASEKHSDIIEILDDPEPVKKSEYDIIDIPDDPVSNDVLSNDESDDCWIYVSLLCSKLRKLDEPIRDYVMLEIDQLLYRAKQKFYQPQPVVFSTPSTSSHNFQTPCVSDSNQSSKQQFLNASENDVIIHSCFQPDES